MKNTSLGAILFVLFAFAPRVQAQDTGSVFLIPVTNPEQICRLHPILVDVGTFIPPPSEFSDPLASRASTINVTYIDDDGADPWPQAAIDAFNYARSIWANHIDSPVAIEIEAHWANLGGCNAMQGVTLGSAGPTFVASWGGSPIANTTYPIALVNAIFGSDQAPGAADVTASFNMDCDDVGSDLWYFGTDGNVPSGKIDFISVVLHELGHGLGFSGSAQYDDGINDTGSGGSNANECTGVTNSGCFSAIPNVYDRFAKDAATGGAQLLDTGVYPNNSTTLGTALVSAVAHFESSSILANNGNTAAPLFGPDPWENGSSYSHFDETSYNGTPDALMTPYLGSQEANHSPGSLTCALFQDIGWPMGPDCVSLLPVEIARFEATAGQDAIVLTWETRTETNNAGFEVELSMGDDVFETIQFIAGAGSTVEPRTYAHTHIIAAAGTYTFRLKQIDFDGRFSYSDPVSVVVQPDNVAELSPVYPNPFNPAAQFSLVLASTQHVRITLVDVAGREIQVINDGILDAARQHSFSFDAGQLPSGMYWIQARGASFSRSTPALLLR